MEDLKIEAGKFYRIRNGDKVEIYSTDNPGIFPIHGRFVVGGKYDDWRNSNLITFTKEGSFSFGGRESEGPKDIIGEWVEPFIFFWDSLPAWSNKYIAMDMDGTWYCYKEKPKVHSDVWSGPPSIHAIKIPSVHNPRNFFGDWKESLFKCPKYI